MEEELELTFNEAFKMVSETEKNLPIDVLLRLYAYYKQAKKGDNSFFLKDNNNEAGLRNAFKFNAWVQLKGMSPMEAKQEYINLANNILNR